MKINIRDLNAAYLFCRIGYGELYNGTDKRLYYGGGYNKISRARGGEECNFLDIDGMLYGYVTTPTDTINLRRIDLSSDVTEVKNVAVVFVAKKHDKITKSSQVIVGWYKQATVFMYYKDRPKVAGINTTIYCMKCAANMGVLIPGNKRNHDIPAGLNAIGQSNIFYQYDANYRIREYEWMMKTIKYVNTYAGANLLNTSLK